VSEISLLKEPYSNRALPKGFFKNPTTTGVLNPTKTGVFFNKNLTK